MVFSQIIKLFILMIERSHFELSFKRNWLWLQTHCLLIRLSLPNEVLILILSNSHQLTYHIQNHSFSFFSFSFLENKVLQTLAMILRYVGVTGYKNASHF